MLRENRNRAGKDKARFFRDIASDIVPKMALVNGPLGSSMRVPFLL